MLAAPIQRPCYKHRMVFSESERAQLLEPAVAAQRDFARRFPGDGGRRQPVHVVYGGMHLFSADTPAKIARLAREQLERYAPTAVELAEVFGLERSIAEPVLTRLQRKLEREPVEDYRIDAEDGYGVRSDDEEDQHARQAGLELARLVEHGPLPPFIGLRVKPLSVELGPRALRTLDQFLSAAAGKLPASFLVTLPKVTDPRQVEVLCGALERMERALGLPRIGVEVMIESGPGLLDASGRCVVPALVEAAGGRLFAAHVGAYDYTASLEIVASRQTLDHVANDHLRQVLKVSLAQTGVFVADGATTSLPLPPHKGATLTEVQHAENTRAIHGAWRAHARNVERALTQGFYQGWDLHPGQLIPRYVASYAFFLSSQREMTQRLSNFVARLGQATAVGTSFDDAATGQGLLTFFLRGLSCGAFEADDLAATGLSRDELALNSFPAIIAGRRLRRP